MPNVFQIIDLDDQAQKGKLFTHLAGLSGKWKLELTKFSPLRSNQQNRYYRIVLNHAAVAMSEVWGYELSPDQAHEFFKLHLLPVRVVSRLSGKTITIGGSTTELSKVQFSEYVDKIKGYILDYCGYSIPDASAYGK